MADHLDSVKNLAKQYRTWADSNEHEKPELSARQIRTALYLEATVSELESARSRLLPVPSSYGDLSDLPPEVLSELNLAKVDELEQQLRDIIVAANGQVGLDPIIIELYRRHKVVQQRRFIMNKLYRMAQKGVIEAVEGRKGVYTVNRPPSGGFSGFNDDLDDDVPF